ncbi:unnamed protein product, partial [Amoebophrya sp. A120]
FRLNQWHRWCLPVWDGNFRSGLSRTTRAPVAQDAPALATSVISFAISVRDLNVRARGSRGRLGPSPPALADRPLGHRSRANSDGCRNSVYKNGTTEVVSPFRPSRGSRWRCAT